MSQTSLDSTRGSASSDVGFPTGKSVTFSDPVNFQPKTTNAFAVPAAPPVTVGTDPTAVSGTTGKITKSQNANKSEKPTIIVNNTAVLTPIKTVSSTSVSTAKPVATQVIQQHVGETVTKEQVTTISTEKGTIPIRIAGQVFNLSFSELDNLRRTEYFRNYGTSTAKLTDEEERLLKVLQIEEPFKKQFRQYLADFFNNLQSCSSDTTIFLRNKCQSTQLLLWNLHFAIQSRLNAMKRKGAAPYSQVNAALNDAYIRAFRNGDVGGIVGGTSPAVGDTNVSSTGMTDQDCLRLLFTLSGEGPGPAEKPAEKPAGPGPAEKPAEKPAGPGPAEKLTEEECLKQLFTL
jgi:hypothetical protein